MNVGLFRRILSLIIDIIPIITILSICFSLFAGDLLKPENYDEYLSSYQQKVEDYNNEVMPYYEQYVAGELTSDEYNEISAPIEASYFDNDETDEQIRTYLQYVGYGFLYYFIGINTLYFIYSVVTKTKTFGRRFAKIELKGKINWWTILLREIIWKTCYWTITLGAGIIIDMFMIGLTRKKICFRDMVSQIRVTHEGIDYPF
jgi:hypothetical protein